MLQSVPPRLRVALAVILTALASLVVVFTVTDDPDQPGHTRTTVTIRLSPLARAAVPDRQLEAPASAVAAVAASDADDHQGGRDEAPPGVTARVLEAGREQQDRLAATDNLPVTAPAAAPSQAGCRSRFITSYSSRRGLAPRMIVLHYTVSPNTPGWGDVDGVTAYFARASTQASSNYVIDGEGHCNYIVREVDKAWTQAAANPFSVSIEQINTGREKVYAAPAGLARTARVVHDIAKRWGIPLRAGRVSGCQVAVSGVVDHHSLGACGGGHFDITPYGAAQVIAAARALDSAPVKRLTVKQRRWCDLLQGYRARVRRGEHPSQEAARRAVARRKLLARDEAPCPRR